ncbi:ATP-dependent RNA helicase Ddx1 (Fragment) [Seminavis robusta]|uniref:ATP-dependent RNA helicase Ddx1 n=1 Tax=Seminavis robusta TaxID=568900 RepID=A0A9N8HDN9_9STRA
MAGGWESLGLLPELVQTCEEDLGWGLPSDIQEEAIPMLLGGRDVMGSAETGSGKTAAFALPVLQLCVEYKEQDQKGSKQGSNNKPIDEKGKGPPDMEFIMSTQDRDQTIAFHPNGNELQLQSSDKTRWAGCRCAAGIKVGKKGDKHGATGYSFECTILDKDGTVRVGWSTSEGSLKLGTDANGWGYGGTGVTVTTGKYDPFPSEGNRASFTKDDVIGCHLEFEDSGGAKISFSCNGKNLGNPFKVGPGKTLYPTICMKNSSCELNFADPLRFPPPNGFQPVSLSMASNEGAKNPNHAHAEKLTDSKRQGPLAIVIEPTRDLAEQSYQAFVTLGKRLRETPVGAALLVGGVKPTETLKMLKENSVDVLVGTPPIIASYLKKGTIQPSRCRLFVLDEADELVSSDSVDNIQSIFGRLVASTEAHQSLFDRLQVCFFSATLRSKEVQELSSTLCHQPLWIDLRGQNDSMLPDTVHHCFIQLNPSTVKLKDDELIETDAVHRNGKLSAKVEVKKITDEASKSSEVIKQLKPRVLVEVMEKFGMDQVLVFCRTNLDCDLLEKYLKGIGSAGDIGIADKYSCRVLAGMRSMEERQSSLRAFKEGDVRILVCTDVAARGIDIRNLPFVINCTLPDKPEIYVHRVGRVGRADHMGLAISLVSTVKERVWFCRKGKKPPCEDTRDFDAGGNCIWYNEPQYFGNIDKLLVANNVKDTKLQYPGLVLPANVEALVANKSYGERVQGNGPLNPEVKAKMDAISSQLDVLTKAESSMQKDYWSIRHRFRNAQAKGVPIA